MNKSFKFKIGDYITNGGMHFKVVDRLRSPNGESGVYVLLIKNQYANLICYNELKFMTCDYAEEHYILDDHARELKISAKSYNDWRLA